MPNDLDGDNGENGDDDNDGWYLSSACYVSSTAQNILHILTHLIHLYNLT